ncbi:MAG: homoserine kinase [Elusimicrobia bacterium]|nr:homoserine kinase [Elusimicrobiota bacterium]
MPRRVRVRVPASTANLGPGFDVLGLALALYNEVELVALSLGDSSPAIQVEGEGAETLPRDERNVVYRAIQRVFDAVGQPSPPLRISLLNRIPLARGLGSSAAAVIGGLVAANTWLGRPLDEPALLSLGLGLEGHPDNLVPALKGDLCIARSYQGKVRYRKLTMRRDLVPVVCIPNFELSTASARAQLPSSISLEDTVFNVGNALLLLAGLTGPGKREKLLELMEDRVHQPYRQSLIPGMADVFAAATKAGAAGVALSGAGPSIFAFAASRRVAHSVGSAMGKVFAQRGIKNHARVLAVDRAGARVFKGSSFKAVSAGVR